jgi:alkylmercury lyase
MTAQSDSASVSVDVIDAALAAASPNLSQHEQSVAVALLRLLAAGAPAGIADVAVATAMAEDRAASIMRNWSGVFWDDRGRVTGFWGLALAGMPPHRLLHAGAELSAWCAFDPLFLARVIGELQVSTADPITGAQISYTIGPDGVIAITSGAGAALSFVHPHRPWSGDVMTTFCHYVHHFTTPGTAATWTSAHPGTFVISLDEAVELARRHAIRAFGTVS